jgi:hypothetical protein
MKISKRSIFAGLCAISLSTLWAMPATAQEQAVKAKPPMYTYIANWQIPRAHWAEMKSPATNEDPMLEKALSDGTIVGYGSDENLVHTKDGWTHDSWFSAMSMAGLVKILDNYYASENSTPPVLQSATKHYDEVLESRYYNWHSGAYKNGVLSVSMYKLKADAPSHALDAISGEVVAPLLEKLLADGTLVEYEIDTEAVHTSAPGTFAIVYVTANPEDLDKVDDAIRASIKARPIEGVAFDAITDMSAHRDEMALSSGKFK